MRDYLQLFWTKDSNPWLPTVVTQYYFFETKMQCQSFIDSNPVSPGGGTLSSVQPVWFRLNKAITIGYINNANVTNIGDGGTPVLDGTGKQMIYLGESPRPLGINSKIEKKGAKNTQTSNVFNSTVFTEIDMLTSLAQTLLKRPELFLQRDGQIILAQLGQALTGRLTINQALSNLRSILEEVHSLGII